MENKMLMDVENVTVAGVYCMKIKDEVLYVGSAIEINDALSRHLYYLKRGLYKNTNKKILQKYYDLRELHFDILWESIYKRKDVLEMDFLEKENLQKELSVLEEMYIRLYKDTICNMQKTVKKSSSNKNRYSTYNRHEANRGSNNPKNKYNADIIANVIWLKQKGLKPKKIFELLLEQNININKGYISNIGTYKWIYTEPKKPNWYTDIESEVI